MNRPNDPNEDNASLETERKGNDRDEASDDQSALASEASELHHQLQEAEARALRLQADLENFRRRTRKEAEDQIKYAALPLITDLLEVVDNLTRALAAADSESGNALVEGVRMVLLQLEQVLEKNGCRRIPSIHMAFDPNIHSAAHMQFSETVPANIVIAEARSGYQLYDRVVRPAHVVVSKGPAI
jgi:molecular chaperone GrpE